MTSDDLLVEWLNSLKEADRSPKTIARYRGAVRQFLAWYEDEERRPMELADLTPLPWWDTGPTYKRKMRHLQLTCMYLPYGPGANGWSNTTVWRRVPPHV